MKVTFMFLISFNRYIVLTAYIFDDMYKKEKAVFVKEITYLYVGHHISQCER